MPEHNLHQMTGIPQCQNRWRIQQTINKTGSFGGACWKTGFPTSGVHLCATVERRLAGLKDTEDDFSP